MLGAFDFDIANLRMVGIYSCAICCQIEIGTMGVGDACKLVVVVRTDLQMGKGKIAAQVCLCVYCFLFLLGIK